MYMRSTIDFGPFIFYAIFRLGKDKQGLVGQSNTENSIFQQGQMKFRQMCTGETFYWRSRKAQNLLAHCFSCHIELCRSSIFLKDQPTARKNIISASVRC
jgi:hypothetical protein